MRIHKSSTKPYQQEAYGWQKQDRKQTKASAKSGRVWRILRNVCFVVLLAIFVLQLVLAVHLQRHPQDLVEKLPFRMLEVTSDSMYPKLRAGDGVFEIDTDFDQLVKGDLITFYQSGNLVTHEIISVNADNTVTTEGLANGIPDAPVSESVYVGKVLVKIPHLSGFLSLSSSAGRKALWIALFAVILFGPEIFSRLYDLFYERSKKHEK